jgi:Bacteriophage head to tail connecting protein
MQIALEYAKHVEAVMTGLETDRLPWWRSWRDIASFYIPKRYNWLLSRKERKEHLQINPNILDGTGTSAGKVLASGMMNGITSPSRPWFKLRLADFEDQANTASRRWLDEVERRLLLIMSESNVYNALAIMYLDLVFFGSASVLIYEDQKTVIRCYNNALGEFFFGHSNRMEVDIHGRQFEYTVRQIVQEYGLENCPANIQMAYKAGGARLFESHIVNHLIEPNDGRTGVSARFPYRETYWIKGAQSGECLRCAGFYELPGVFVRWEVTGNDAYGTGPALDALGDVIQLQHETKRKGQSLDYMVRPPMLLSSELENKPSGLIPGGKIFVRNIEAAGAKPAYMVNAPIQEMTMDLRDIQGRIKEIFHNDLFQMISQLETVRTATEIDARREEKLVLLGPVFDRFKTEALDPLINRVFQVAQRAGLLPEAPPEIADQKMEISYVSILASAQSAVGVVPVERWLGFIGNIAGVYPKALNIPNWDQILRDYGKDLGVKSKHIQTPEEVAQANADQDQEQAAGQAAEAAPQAAQAAKLLSETDVGGGMSALQTMMGS